MAATGSLAGIFLVFYANFNKLWRFRRVFHGPESRNGKPIMLKKVFFKGTLQRTKSKYEKLNFLLFCIIDVVPQKGKDI